MDKKIIKKKVLLQYDFCSEKYGQDIKDELRAIMMRDFGRHMYIISSVLRYAPLKHHKEILDVCIGFGVPSRVLRSYGYNIQAIDSEIIGGKDICRITREDFPLKIVNNIETEMIPFGKDSFDVILWLATIEHLRDSPKEIMEQFNKILKINGILIVDTPNILSLRNRLMLLFGKSFMPPIQFIYYSDYNASHHREYTLQDLIKVFKWSKFEIVEAKVLDTISPISIEKRTPYHKRSLEKGEIYEMTKFKIGFNFLNIYDWIKLPYSLLVKFFPNLGDTLYIVGRKK